MTAKEAKEKSDWNSLYSEVRKNIQYAIDYGCYQCDCYEYNTADPDILRGLGYKVEVRNRKHWDEEENYITIYWNV